MRELLAPSPTTQPDLFLRILVAEKEGFITYTIDAPAESAKDANNWGSSSSSSSSSSSWPLLLQTLHGLYMPYRTGGVDTSLVDAWNQQRKVHSSHPPTHPPTHSFTHNFPPTHPPTRRLTVAHSNRLVLLFR